MQDRHFVRGGIHTTVKNVLETKELTGNFNTKSKKEIYILSHKMKLQLYRPSFVKKGASHKPSVSQEKQDEGSVFYIIDALKGYS